VPESTSFQAPRGTFDVLPPESGRYEQAIGRFASVVERAGYGLVISPMFEDLGVFQRVGESTDLVRKEMYDFYDKSEPPHHLALRPEGTASVVRAWVQHRPTLPFKAWYAAPSFRYEAPQAGRFRQHHQLGVEALGTDDPDLDVEVITLLAQFYADLGLRRIVLRLNSLGDGTCRPAYRAELEAFLQAAADRGALCDEHRTRFADNPLRVLDCKKPECVAATADAPFQVDRLCEPCQAHFDRVKAGLESLGIAYVLDPRLVRGLDYYTRTTFEFAAEALDSAQNAVGGGGRYDGLVAELGGPPTPGIGFGCGVERVLLACDAEGVFPPPGSAVDVFVVDSTGGEEALRLTHELRQAGLRADRAFGNRSFKSQFKAADRSGARYALIVGSDELERKVVALRDLRRTGDAAGAPQPQVPAQAEVDRSDVIDLMRKLIHP
jgi:histidyl-tRNA synthetase